MKFNSIQNRVFFTTKIREPSRQWPAAASEDPLTELFIGAFDLRSSAPGQYIAEFILRKICRIWLLEELYFQLSDSVRNSPIESSSMIFPSVAQYVGLQDLLKPMNAGQEDYIKLFSEEENLDLNGSSVSHFHL